LILQTKLFGKDYRFQDLKDVMAKANEEKSGDNLAGIAAKSTAERVAAKVVLSEILLEEIFENPLISYESDEVTRVIIDQIDISQYQQIKNWTVGELREFFLSQSAEKIYSIRDGLTPEMIAASTKIMSNLDLIYATKKILNPATCNTTIGLPGTLSSRLQPNHPIDHPEGILATTMEGIAFGVGDAVIGVNPVDDTADRITRVITALNKFIEKWQIPTQNCVLGHITNQVAALKQGLPMDLLFQSIAGSQKANEGFGINVELLDDAYGLLLDKKRCKGPNCMYFETGQGSALSSESHFGVDQLTMEARNYGLAKRYHPFLVNSVVGFIGPEYLYDGRQVIRAGLEDHFMGKIVGLPMGCDICYTNHTQADQNDLENLGVLLASANCTYFMGVPCSDDVMLMYQSSSFHDIAAFRTITAKRPIREFEIRMEELGIMKNGQLSPKAGDLSIFEGGN
jgi:ethanolamine ammonia-lyase large subunit